jgi:hypothetical protein
MSRAFPNPSVIQHSIHRAPYGVGWLREEQAYDLCPHLTPDHISRFYYAGRLLAWREVPAGRETSACVVWLRPVNTDAKNGWLEIDELASGKKPL